MAKTAKPKAQAAPQTAQKKTGRPSKYTPELAAEIARRLSEGEPLRQICRDEHMPHWTNMYEWMAQDPQLSVRIARAREAGYDKMAEECLELADTPALYEKVVETVDPTGKKHVAVTRSDDVNARRLQVETRLKLLSKWNPTRYGDRVTMAGDAENPVSVQADLAFFDAILKNMEAKRQLGNKGLS